MHNLKYTLKLGYKNGLLIGYVGNILQSCKTNVILTYLTSHHSFLRNIQTLTFCEGIKPFKICQKKVGLFLSFFSRKLFKVREIDINFFTFWKGQHLFFQSFQMVKFRKCVQLDVKLRGIFEKVSPSWWTYVWIC